MPKQTTKHTPTPWQANGPLVVVDCYGKVIAATDVSIDHPPKRYVEIAESKANAAFIVQAVNAYDEREAFLRLVANGNTEYDTIQEKAKKLLNE